MSINRSADVTTCICIRRHKNTGSALNLPFLSVLWPPPHLQRHHHEPPNYEHNTRKYFSAIDSGQLEHPWKVRVLQTSSDWLSLLLLLDASCPIDLLLENANGMAHEPRWHRHQIGRLWTANCLHRAAAGFDLALSTTCSGLAQDLGSCAGTGKTTGGAIPSCCVRAIVHGACSPAPLWTSQLLPYFASDAKVRRQIMAPLLITYASWLPNEVHKKGSSGVDFRPTTFGSLIQKIRFRIG